jgi:hypothetical protein
MWIVEIGRIGTKPGEANTTTVHHAEEASRGAAEFVGKKLLMDRGVSDADATKMAAMTDHIWCDDFPTSTAIRIYER